jgi:Ca-activated chloride channel family protein
VSFHSPLWLIALVALPVLAGLYVRRERRGRRGREAFAPAALLPAVAPRRPGWRRHGAPAFYALALAALIVAVARPQTTVAVPIEQATVILVTDRSGSMAASDVQPSRLAAARNAAERFLGRVPKGVRVGAVAFNHLPALVQSPTTDRASVRAALADLRPAGGTATGDALALALRTARRPARIGAKPPPAAIVLLSDGKSVRGRNPVAVARQAARVKVPIYTVALGTASGTIEIPRASGGTRVEPVPPDPATMRAVARASGGQSFAADSASKLGAVYQRLGSQVARRPERREVTAAAAGGALVFILAGALASLGWFGRLP